MKKKFSMAPLTKKMMPVLLSAVFLLPLAAQAEIKAGSFELNPYAGYNFFDNQHNLKDRPIYGLRLGYNITNRFGIEGAVDFSDTGVDDKNATWDEEGQFTSPINDVDITSYSLDLLYHFMPESNFNPFIAVGYGANHYSPEINSRDMAVLNFGIGAKYWLAENLALRADVRDNMIIDEHLHNITATAGIVFAFGGDEKPVAAQPAPKPVVVVAPAPAPVVVAPAPAPAPVVVAPAPAPAPVVVAKEIVSFNLLFGFDKSAITDDMVPVLQQAKAILEEDSRVNFTVSGHTDSTGPEAYNQGLSERRAASIKNWLVSNGVSAARLQSVGYGETQPKYDNATTEGRKLNRRVELQSK